MAHFLCWYLWTSRCLTANFWFLLNPFLFLSEWAIVYHAVYASIYNVSSAASGTSAVLEWGNNGVVSVSHVWLNSGSPPQRLRAMSRVALTANHTGLSGTRIQSWSFSTNLLGSHRPDKVEANATVGALNCRGDKGAFIGVVEFETGSLHPRTDRHPIHATQHLIVPKWWLSTLH